MNNTEVTIITSFFDVGRKNFEGEFARNNDKYFEDFKMWARIKNNIIVYTNSEMAKKVETVRSEFGLLDKTKVIVIDDFSILEPALFERMNEVSKSQEFLKFRYMPNPADNNAQYDYIMLLKSWCLNDVAEKKLATGLLLWLDFGFTHGGAVYPNSEEFNFTLKVDFPNDKITLFSLKDDDGKPIFQIVQSYDTYMMGFMMYVPSNLANLLWSDIKSAMNSLLDVGFIDDDQTLLLMISRNHKERYNIIKSNWLLPLKEYGGEHLTTITTPKKMAFEDRILRKYRVNKRNRNCIKNLKSLFMKNDY